MDSGSAKEMIRHLSYSGDVMHRKDALHVTPYLSLSQRDGVKSLSAESLIIGKLEESHSRISSG